MKLILSATEASLANAWEKFCGDLEFVEVQRGSILDVDCDAVVSPANSFGFMDGGIDALYMDYFGSEIQMIVRKQILEQHGGELIVGNADVVETGNDKIPFLSVAGAISNAAIMGRSKRETPVAVHLETRTLAVLSVIEK